MGVWIAIALLGVVKMSFAAVMLWLPFRDDSAMDSTGSSSDDDGGSKVPPPSGGRNPRHPRHPRSPSSHAGHRPRRGPHGTPAPASPPRTRIGRTRTPATRPCGR